MFRAQELCESRGGRSWLPVPTSPCGLGGRKVTLNNTELWSCVKGRGGRPELPVHNSPCGLCGRKARMNQRHWRLQTVLTGTLLCVARQFLLLLALALTVVTAVVRSRVGARALVFHGLFATAARQAARALLLYRVFRPTTVLCTGRSGGYGLNHF